MPLAHRRAAWTGLLLALLLTGLGAWRQGGRTNRTPDAGRVVVAGVRGGSWDTLVGNMDQDRSAALASLLSGPTVESDIVASGYNDPGEVLASLATGKAPDKHRVRSFHQAHRFRRCEERSCRPVWESLSREGHAVAVVGWPFWAPLAGERSWVIPDWDQFSGTRTLYRNAREIDFPQAWERHLLAPDKIAQEWIDRVAGDAPIPDALLPTLRSSLAADHTMTALAGELFRGADEPHLFLYLEGLHAWRRQLEAVDDVQATDWIAGYHDLLDLWIDRIRSWDDGATTFFLFSEQGNDGGAIGYRAKFPALEQWPPIGWMVAWGRGIEPGAEPWIVSPVDLATTVLHLSGSPIPNDMDGVILHGFLHDDFHHRHRVAFAP